MRRLVRLLALCAFALSLAACGRPFKIKTAPGLVELDEKDDSPYEFRAIAPDGVVVAVRVIDTYDRGDLDLWTHAVILRMQQVNGYALLGTSDVMSRDGTPGKELHFGHDEGAGRKPFAYDVRLFVAQSRLFLLEAGGTTEAMKRFAPSIDWMKGSLRVVCGAVGYPVFASHTCHRW